tara:strand:+ start:6779 stop:7408 length:630 start_codon:yes stop_codon:yes gene_type:complete
MSGTGASNLGYGNDYPFSNVNKNFVNVDSNNNPMFFGSNQIPGLPGISGAKNNIDAANGYVPGICLFKGGSHNFKQKINKISRKYKMRKSIKHTSRIKRLLRNKYSKKSNTTTKRINSRKKSKSKSRSRPKRRVNRSRRKYRGGWSYPPGYSQFQSNQPITHTYSVGATLAADDSALANPPPYKVLANNTNCADNYNHYSDTTFPSRGH